jgi:membrane associated rhomboid family serine protease
VYGYFVEWYYGRTKYVVALVLALAMSHFLSCIALPTSVSTTSSSALFAVLALKLYFLYEYKDYKPLLNRRTFIIILLTLILVINLIPIFISNNVDYTNHIAGFVTGMLMVLFIHISKEEEPQKIHTVIKFSSILMIGAIIIICISLIYGLPDKGEKYKALNENIDYMCNPLAA